MRPRRCEKYSAFFHILLRRGRIFSSSPQKFGRAVTGTARNGQDAPDFPEAASEQNSRLRDICFAIYAPGGQYFSKAFRKIMGISPRRYQETLQK